MILLIMVILLTLFSILLLWQFLGYPLTMEFLARYHRSKEFDDTYLPFVSIIVPTFNEEKSIGKRIDNLRSLDYPYDRYEILIVDSGSQDKTVSISEIKAAEKTSPSVKILREKERRGKASAINFGQSVANGEIIVVTDANCIFNKDVLKKIIPYFKDPSVGAVGGRFVVLNAGENELASSTQFYWEIEAIMRMGESKLDSACLFHGELNAWRKGIVRADERMISEDLDMAIQIRKKNYRIEYEPDAIVYEPAPTTIKDQIKQRKRTSVGTIQCIHKHLRYLLIPCDYYRAIIFPSHKTLVMLSPFFALGIMFLYILFIIIGRLDIVIIHVVSMIITASLLFIAFLQLKKTIIKRTCNQQFSDSIRNGTFIHRIISYIFLNEYLILLAWKDYLLKRYSVLWEKVESTRN